MAIKYLYKCNPLVAKAAGVTAFDRFTWADGTFLLWENDLIAIDRDRFFLDRDGFLADLGAARMTDPEAAEEQRNPQMRLPEARLPEYRWEQPSQGGESVAESVEEQDLSADEATEEAEDGTSVPDGAAVRMTAPHEEGGEE